MNSALRRAAASLTLLALGGLFLAYAAVSMHFAQGGAAIHADGRWCRLHPEAWIREGNRRYYMELNAEAAAGFYRKAIAANPLLIGAWLALAESEMLSGREAEGRRALETLAPFLDRVSTWKWQELVLAHEVRDEAYFERCFNFVLRRLPHRVREASYMASSLWGGWAGAMPHVSEENRAVYLKELMRAREVEVALELWSAMTERPDGITRELRLRFSEFLLGQKRVKEARTVWEGFLEGESLGIHDGGFEGPPLGQAFGWRWSRQGDVAVERSMEAPHEGSYSLHLRFNGARNVSFGHVHQVVPVEGGKDYVLTYAQRSRNLTTDQGVALELSGSGCGGLKQRSEPLQGSSPWTRGQLSFTVPSGCEAVVLRVARKESLKLDSRIAGDYWLDSVSLKPAP